MDFDAIGTRDELLKLVPNYRWTHSIDLGGGVRTPGNWGTQPFLVRALDQIEFRGKSVLDIGCWDGLWSFEAEKRGATEVVATDDVRQRHFSSDPTFQLVRKILGSRAKYYSDVSVYDVGRLVEKPFDVVLFLGVYYHLKHPLLALSRLRKVTKDGGLIVVEGETTLSDRSSADFYYREEYCQDRSNWWIPSVRCLREWVECSAFRIRGQHAPDVPHPTRCAFVAEAVRGPDANYAYPDDELDGLGLVG
jgi:tRNA (mo5U34)-methyltransferase